MLTRFIAPGVLLLGLAGGCATPLPGWRVSASVGRCEAHLSIVVADAGGVVREVDDVHSFLGERIDALPEVLELSRGSDGADEPELVATGRYVGVDRDRGAALQRRPPVPGDRRRARPTAGVRHVAELVVR